MAKASRAIFGYCESSRPTSSERPTGSISFSEAKTSAKADPFKGGKENRPKSGSKANGAPQIGQSKIEDLGASGTSSESFGPGKNSDVGGKKVKY